jgi:hypothetical protein
MLIVPVPAARPIVTVPVEIKLFNEAVESENGPTSFSAIPVSVYG